MICVKLILLLAFCNQVISTGIPIWELLTETEKIGNLTFLLLNLVHLYCKQSDIPDCEKVLTLYGVSNLLKVNRNTLDLLDPHHRNTNKALWRTAMNGASFNFPQGGKSTSSDARPEFEREFNTITTSDTDYSFPQFDYDVQIGEPHPYAVRVPPPSNFKINAAGFKGTPNNNKNNQHLEFGSSLTQDEQVGNENTIHSPSRVSSPGVVSSTPNNNAGLKNHITETLRNTQGTGNQQSDHTNNLREPLLYTILKK